MIFAVCLHLTLNSISSAFAAPVLENINYHSSVSTDSNGPLDLIAELNYDSTRNNAPIAVVMHGYGSGDNLLLGVRPNAERLRDAGFFVVSVAMREREGSDGKRDSGGVEIYDIYDAVESVKAQYPQLVNKTNISITGYSGGGGNVLSALTKFPDYFRAGSAFFGMSDYGYDTTRGWFFNGADAGNKAHLIPDIGDPTLGDPGVRDRYMARATNLAAKNNPYSEIHLFVNANETNVPPIHSTSYRDLAVAAATSPGEFDKIQVHIGGTGQYVDFNNNGVNDPNELQDWPHQNPTANQQHAAEAWYLSRLLDGSIKQPSLNLQDTLFVGGYVKTERFSLWLGDGQNAAGELAYNLAGDTWSFALDVLSSNQNIKGTLTIDTGLLTGKNILVKLNNQPVETFLAGGQYRFDNFRNGDRLTLATVPEPKTSMLWGSGILGMLFVTWRCRRRGINMKNTERLLLRSETFCK